MSFKDAIHSSLNIANFLSTGYLADITPEEMVMRPAPDANHIAWQLGHLIAAERHLVEAAAPGSMPELPAGFNERHRRDGTVSDNPADYLSKDEYLQLAATVRAGTLDALDKLPEADFSKPVTARVPPFCKTGGGLLRHDRPALGAPRWPVGRAASQAGPPADVLKPRRFWHWFVLARCRKRL